MSTSNRFAPNEPNESPIAYYNFPKEAYPIIIEFIKNGKVIKTDVVSGPGVMRVEAMKVDNIRVTFADGEVIDR